MILYLSQRPCTVALTNGRSHFMGEVILDIENRPVSGLEFLMNPSTGPMAKIRFSPGIATSDKRLAISRLVN